MKNYFLLFFLLLFNKAFAQQTAIDSLQTIFSNTSNTEEKLELLFEISNQYANIDLEKAVTYAKQGVELADKTSQIKWQPKLYEATGRIHANMLQLDSASYYFSKAAFGYKSIDNKKGQATTLFKIGWVHKKRGELQEALEADLQALKLMEAIGDKEGIAGAMSRLSEDVLRQGRKKEALDYALKTIQLSKEHNFPVELIYAYKSAGEASIAMGNNKDAYFYFDSALTKAREMNFDLMSLSDFMNDRGNALKRLGRYPEALVQYKAALAAAQKINYANAIRTVEGNLGEVNLILGNYKEALPYQLKSITLQEQDGDLSNLPENYMHLSTSFEKLGNYKVALAYQKKARIMGDSIAALESDRAMSELLTQYETEKKEATIETQSLQIEQQQQTQLLYIALAGLLGLLVFGLFFTLRNISKKRTTLASLNNELSKKNQQNELLLKEIHHRVKNNLELVKSLIALQSAKLEDGASKEAMLASQNRVQSMGIIHQKLYQGTNLGAIEMKDYFVNLSEGVLETFDAEDRVKIECSMENIEVDVDTAVPIGLIVNELLTNSLKYAFPNKTKGEIQIRLRQDNNILSLEVSDNGIGIADNTSVKGTGFGTQLISLLTQQLNGTLTRVTDKGTAVHFQFKEFTIAS